MKGLFARETPNKDQEQRLEPNIDPRLRNALQPEPEATDPADFQQISVALPPYVIKQIKRRAAEEGTTQRYEILRCISEGGFEVYEADLVPDARRSKR